MDQDLNLKRNVIQLENLLISSAMQKTSGNKTQVAKILGTSTHTLPHKIKKLCIS